MVGVYDITIIQGSDNCDVSVVPTEDDDSPISLNGFTARMQIRDCVDSSTILDTLTTANSRITITSYVEDAETFWRVKLLFPSAITSAYTWENGVYDLELVQGTNVFRYLEGQVTVNKEVTR